MLVNIILARDCSDVKKFNSSAEDGVFTINPFEDASRTVEAFCEFDSDSTGWTVSCFFVNLMVYWHLKSSLIFLTFF